MPEIERSVPDHAYVAITAVEIATCFDEGTRVLQAQPVEDGDRARRVGLAGLLRRLRSEERAAGSEPGVTVSTVILELEAWPDQQAQR